MSAPAGFGKRTLLTEWLAAGPARPGHDRLVAWLSLDRADNEPTSFWTYVIAALRTVASGVGASALTYLQAPQPPAIETVLTGLLNDLGTVAGEIVLVLGDYHVIDAGDVQEGMACARAPLISGVPSLAYRWSHPSRNPARQEPRRAPGQARGWPIHGVRTATGTALLGITGLLRHTRTRAGGIR